MSQSVLAELGIVGFKSIEPVLLAALFTEEPLLLIGPHGTGKSYALLRIAAALGLESRHYNASLLNFDDLVGFPMPNAAGSLDYVKTPGSIWGAQIVFFDEISRCRPDMQNKLFPIIHERRVQGLGVDSLVYRWSAMNPPWNEDDETTADYRGSEQLDAALADRFAFVVEIPEWASFTSAEQEGIISAGWSEPAPEVRSKLSNILSSGGHLTTQLLQSNAGEKLATYVRVLGNLLQKSALALSPRRLNTIRKSIAAVHAARILTERKPSFAESALLAITHSFPQRAAGRKIESIKLVPAHRQAWEGVFVDEPGPLLHVLAEPDPLRRVTYAASAESLTKAQFSTIVADALAQLPNGARHALAARVFESGATGRLIAAVAAQCAELYAFVATPQGIHESVAAGSPRHRVWEHVVSRLAALPASQETDMTTNLLAGLFNKETLVVPTDVDKTILSWSAARQTLGAQL